MRRRTGSGTGSGRQRFAGVLALLVLAPWVGEYLLGNIPLSQLVALPFLVPMYGCGALLIREVTRRSGRGWPTVLLLGAAYGVVEAGLVDQSLFNQHFEGTGFLSRTTYLPALGLTVSDGLSFVAGHAVWSVGTAVAFAEFAVPDLRRTPWLGRTGLSITAVLYLLGCLIVYRDLVREEGFVASAGQRLGAVATALALIVLGLVLPSAEADGNRRPGRVPRPWVLGAGTLVVLGAFFGRPEDWAGVVLGGALLAGGSVVLRWLSGRAGFGVRHEWAVAGGALLTYAWGGFVLTQLVRPHDPVARLGNILFAAAAVILLIWTGRRLWPDTGRC